MDFQRALESSEPLKDLCDKSEILLLHGLYKQAMYGDCLLNTRPLLDTHGVEKWKRWVDFNGMAEKEARQQYTEAVQKLLEKYQENLAG